MSPTTVLSSPTPAAPWQKRLQTGTGDLSCLSAEARTLAQRPLREACSTGQPMGAMLGAGPDWSAGGSAPDWEPPSLEQPPPSVQCEAWSLQTREPGCSVQPLSQANRLPGRNLTRPRTVRAAQAVTGCYLVFCGQIKAKRPPWHAFLEASLGSDGNMERSSPPASGLALAQAATATKAGAVRLRAHHRVPTRGVTFTSSRRFLSGCCSSRRLDFCGSGRAALCSL